jgi:hypothetical protein
MTTKQALNRIFWRFGGNDNSNPFPINEKDIEAFNALYDEHIERQKKQFHSYSLFAKLYTYQYMKILENDRSTVKDNFARKKIYNLLKKPLPQIIEDFQKSLNDSEQYGLLETINEGEVKHPATQTEAEKATNFEKLEKLLKDPENQCKFDGEVWDYKTVQELVEAEVNQAINKFQ